VRVTLEPLDIEEAADYLLHHVRAAGGKPEEIFSGEALELLARNTHGLPRLLSQAAHQALRLAASAGGTEVDAEAVLEALTLLGLPGEVSVDHEENAGVLLVDADTGSGPMASAGEEEAQAEAVAAASVGGHPFFVAPGRSA
jgi:hypothetical protein